MKILDEQEQLNEDQISLRTDSPDISVFLPVFNEEPNLLPLHAKLDEALKSLGRSAEIVYVDDGSSDGSLKILREIAQLDPRVRVAQELRSNCGVGRGHRRGEGKSPDSDGRRSSERSRGHRTSPR
jgi:cellulose synthase/poly-beta-1,6-N-acetylglucosamine synthase-like glycosyltransferase